MNTDNPYEAPHAALHAPHADADGFLGEPRELPVGAGMEWLAAGWKYFAAAPGPWIGMMVLFFALVMVVSMLPIIGMAANLLTTVLMGGLLLGCDAQRRGEPLTVAHLFGGFSNGFVPLLAVGALYLAATMVVVVVMLVLMFALFGGLGMLGADGLDRAADVSAIIGIVALVVALVVALTIPLAMAFWFAPPLVVFNGLGAVDAMALSFRACLRNFVPLLVFFLLLLGAALIATLPLLLGWFALWPTAMAATFVAYRDTFYQH